MHLFQRTALFFAFSVQFLPNVVSAAVSGPLKAGAARVEITPDTNAIPRYFTSILDSLYARAIYLENGHDRAVLLNADVGAIPTTVTDKVAGEISQQLNVPVTNILISATHDHSAIFGGPASRPQVQENTTAKLFQEKMASGLIQAAKQIGRASCRERV